MTLFVGHVRRRVSDEEVRDDHHPPRRRHPDQDGNRQGEEPAEDEEALAPDPIGERAGEEVRERLRRAEGDDEGEDRRLRAEAEVALADERQHAPLESDERADERVQPDEERELRRVRPQPEAHGRRGHGRTATAPRLLAATISAWSAGGGGKSARSDSESPAASARLWRRSKPIVENGFPESARPQTEPA